MKIETIGQKSAVAQLTAQANLVIENNEAVQPILVEGESGVGKSHISGQFSPPLAEEWNANFITVKSASDLALSDGPMDEIIETVSETANGVNAVIEIDEAHGLPFRPFHPAPGPSIRFWNSLILGAGEGWNRSGEIVWTKGKMIPFNAKHLQLVLLTNHPERIGGGKNIDAILRRMLRVKLIPYTSAEMRKVVPAFMAKKGRTIDADAAKELVKFHRGTLQAIEDILRNIPHRGHITLADITEAMKVSEFKLRGFRAIEIKALRHLMVTKEPCKAGNLSERFPSLDVGAFFRHSVNQFAAGKDENGDLIQIPFLKKNSRNEYEVEPPARKWFNRNTDSLEHIFAQQ